MRKWRGLFFSVDGTIKVLMTHNFQIQIDKHLQAAEKIMDAAPLASAYNLARLKRWSCRCWRYVLTKEQLGRTVARNICRKFTDTLYKCIMDHFQKRPGNYRYMNMNIVWAFDPILPPSPLTKAPVRNPQFAPIFNFDSAKGDQKASSGVLGTRAQKIVIDKNHLSPGGIKSLPLKPRLCYVMEAIQLTPKGACMRLLTLPRK